MTAFDHALGFVEHHLGDADVAGCGFVEGGGDNFGIDRACHVGHFFGTLVDEEHHEIGVGIVGGNGIGDLLHQNRLTRFGLCDDECALSLADGRKQVDDAAGQRCVAAVREFELFVGKERGEVLKGYAVAYLIGSQPIDAVNAHQREVLFALAGDFDFALHHVAHLQCVAADLILRDEHVVGRGHIIII